MGMVERRTDELFIAATLSEDSLGYPDDVSFVPGDQPWADDVVWANLADLGLPTVVVDDETELLLIPLPRRFVDRVRGRVRVRVAHRSSGQRAEYATESTLGRRPVREMRELARG